MNENKNLVAREVAEGDVYKWLDAKKIPESQRVKNESSITALVNAVQDGRLIITEDGITQKLSFPITDGNGKVTRDKLVWKLRMNGKDRREATKGVSANDALSMMEALIAWLTSQPRGVIGCLDSVDSSICNDIIIFFT